MPVTYRIVEALALVHSTWEGRITLDDSLGHNEALAADPDFRPCMRQLSDASRATSAVSADGIRRLAKHSPFGPKSRRAIVVADDAMFGVSRMYEAQADDAGTVRIFRDPGQALDWLGIGPDDLDRA